MNKSVNELAVDDRTELLNILAARFNRYPKRHPQIKWELVKNQLEAHPDKLKILYHMEETGGEPDVIQGDDPAAIVFFDCAAESPLGRRSLCYDRPAWESRKANRPEGTVVDMAVELGIELLNEEQYRLLQRFGPFDNKTSSWLKTPDEVRKLGGAIFGDLRYGRIFIYHNGADAYYGSRGFRGLLRL